MSCIKNGLEKNAGTLLFAATLFALIAGIIAVFGGLTIALGPIILGVVYSAILAALFVFGAVVAAAVLVIILNCAIGATAPGIDEVPPENDGIQLGDLQPASESAQALTEELDNASKPSRKPEAKKND